MRIRRVQTIEDIQKAYPCSTEIPYPFWENGLPACREWMRENLGTTIEGLHLEEDDGTVIGHSYWGESSHALAPYIIEDGVAFVYCDWVQEHAREQGGAHMLFEELVSLARTRKYKGIMVDATNLEGYMYYGHFLKRGFQVLQEREGSKLLYYPLRQGSVEVKPLKVKIPRHGATAVEVLVIGACFCPVGASAVMAVRKVAEELGDRVTVREIPANRETITKYGVADGVFINGKAKFYGPVTENEVRKAIEEEL